MTIDAVPPTVPPTVPLEPEVPEFAMLAASARAPAVSDSKS